MNINRYIGTIAFDHTPENRDKIEELVRELGNTIEHYQWLGIVKSFKIGHDMDEDVTSEWENKPPPEDDRGTCQDRIEKSMKSIEEDFEKAFEIHENDEWNIEDTLEDYDEENEEYPPNPEYDEEYHQYDDIIEYINNYGLCFDYVEAGTFRDQKEGYWRYQISTGGPGTEYRFYMNDMYQDKPDKILYVYLDWFDGAARHAEGTVAEELWNYMQEWRNC